ncbi:hypothetical protein [Nitrosococcus wardiae]|uniref:Uncharacterized protein n=1 Tax=Nitrosococcus wardiae TaxID=1814290 RepID=A0A4P7BYA5_9GAMM|nr:hypothetical protein [Nitrosococcus wardiae]QBQ55153.1 hypothetical protein E3U44_12020 [Nitrosococcus wardiae]
MFFFALVLTVLFFFPQLTQAHERRIIGQYQIVVGNHSEPAFVFIPNAADIFITRIAGVDKPINAREGDIVDLELYVQFCGKNNFTCGNNWIKLEDPEQARGTENRYNSYYLPTQPGTYAFRVKGLIADSDPEGAASLEIEEVFVCGEGSLSSDSQFGCVEKPLAVPGPAIPGSVRSGQINPNL